MRALRFVDFIGLLLLADWEDDCSFWLSLCAFAHLHCTSVWDLPGL
jgi:hypothetical protein